MASSNTDTCVACGSRHRDDGLRCPYKGLCRAHGVSGVCHECTPVTGVVIIDHETLKPGTAVKATGMKGQFKVINVKEDRGGLFVEAYGGPRGRTATRCFTVDRVKPLPQRRKAKQPTTTKGEGQ